MSGREPDEPAPLQDALARFLRHAQLPSVDTTVSIFGRWDELVGPEVAAHARPVVLERDRLVVEVDESVWASELRWRERVVLDHLRAELGASAPAKLEIRVQRGGDPQRAPRP